MIWCDLSSKSSSISRFPNAHDRRQRLHRLHKVEHSALFLTFSPHHQSHNPQREPSIEWMGSVCSSPHQCTRVISPFLIWKQKTVSFLSPLLKKILRVSSRKRPLTLFIVFITFSFAPMKYSSNTECQSERGKSGVSREETGYSEVNWSARCQEDVHCMWRDQNHTHNLLLLTKAGLYSGLVIIWINPITEALLSYFWQQHSLITIQSLRSPWQPHSNALATTHSSIIEANFAWEPLVYNMQQFIN